MYIIRPIYYLLCDAYILLANFITCDNEAFIIESSVSWIIIYQNIPNYY